MLPIYYIGCGIFGLWFGFALIYLPRRKDLPENTFDRWTKISGVLNTIWVGGGAFASGLLGYGIPWFGLLALLAGCILGLVCGRLWPIPSNL